MITFHSIEWRNFLSTGNTPNKVLLDKSSTTLIVGKNGNGKSSILCALCFSLFGKPFRDITKNQLINSINGKGCLVEIEFSKGAKKYKVRRGIKPNIFEIYEDGKMLNQDSASRDYQKILEQQILGLSYKTFTQVVILGSASFVPFMQLPSNQRREVIEDILDIRIFSVMNQLLKDKVSQTKSEISQIEFEVESTKTKVENQTKLIKVLSDIREDSIRLVQEKIAKHNEDVSKTQLDIERVSNEITTLTDKIKDKSSVQDDLKKAERVRNNLQSKIETCETHKLFFEDNDVCPSCTQSIPEEHKLSVIRDLNIKVADQTSKVDELESLITGMNDRLSVINRVVSDLSEKNLELSTKTSTLSYINKQILALENELTTYKNNTSNIDDERLKLKSLAQEVIEKIKVKNTLLEQRSIEDIAGVLLKDSGIKTTIIREYLPAINKMINKYLTHLDAYIHFELDESFNEQVKSRYRDDFTYSSFSEGEKQKIDLAILFAWRQIAKLKNSVNTNLLIMDEIFDASLDSHGTELLMNLLDEVSVGSNVFVISHKSDNLYDKFRSVITFEKINDFSVMK